MKKEYLIVGGIAVAIGGYFLWRRWKEAQRAQAHPIAVLPDSRLLKPVGVDVSLVTDAQVLKP